MSGKADGLADFPKYLSCECAKKRKGVWGGELPGTSGEIYWALMKKRQSREKKGFALRRDQNKGEKRVAYRAPTCFRDALYCTGSRLFQVVPDLDEVQLS